jgi:drug/metabolite transporter (DMT)-like permease
VTVVLFLLVLLSEGCSVAGQIILKQVMTRDHPSRAAFARAFAVPIAFMALAFFLWLGLLSKFELSYLYPFDGLNRLMLVTGATIFLKEKMTPQLWLGVILISLGVSLVSAS